MENPKLYLRFAGHRLRPGLDLLARVSAAFGPRIAEPQVRPILRAVDLGCGPGNLTVRLLPLYPKAKVLGVDMSGSMIERARQMHAGKASDRLTFLQKPLEDFSLNDMDGMSPKKFWDIPKMGMSLNLEVDVSPHVSKTQLPRRYIVRILVWHLWQKGLSSRMIASDERVPLTDRWVRKWMRRFEEGHGHVPIEELVLDLPRSGRTEAIIKKMILNHVYLKDYRSTREAAQWMRTKGVIISKNTIQRFLKARGLYPYHRRKVPKMTDDQKKRRVRFAQEWRNHDWSNTLYTDEKDFWLFKAHNPKNNVVWAMNANEVPPMEVAQGAGKLSVWGGISVHGKTDLQFSKGSLNAHAYQKILKKGQPSMLICFPEQDWGFMHDEALLIRRPRSTAGFGKTPSFHMGGLSL
eukprot:g21580.t1